MGELEGLRSLSQGREMPAQTEVIGLFRLAYAYARSAESQDANQLGQDYIVWRADATRLVFALCDGVSQSFYGELAARFVGDAVTNWLWAVASPTASDSELSAELTEQLRQWSGPATVLVQQQTLPAGIPEMQRIALEQKRILGSQSMFVAGHIDLPSATLPHGRLLCCWLGDCRLRAWRGNVEESGLSTGSGGAERWSTRTGAVGGTPHVYTSPLQHEGQPWPELVAYSDGLAELDSWLTRPRLREVQAAIARSAQMPTSDDVSFVHIALDRVGAASRFQAAPQSAESCRRLKQAQAIASAQIAELSQRRPVAPPGAPDPQKPAEDSSRLARRSNHV